jgi:hypothetical protein
VADVLLKEDLSVIDIQKALPGDISLYDDPIQQQQRSLTSSVVDPMASQFKQTPSSAANP